MAHHIDRSLLALSKVADCEKDFSKHFYVEFTHPEHPVTYCIRAMYEDCMWLYRTHNEKWLSYFKNAIKILYEQHPNLLNEFDMEDLLKWKKICQDYNRIFGVSKHHMDRWFHVHYLSLMIELKKNQPCSDYVLK
jgi:hypothetical protein